jgi:hypothetical protein
MFTANLVNLPLWELCVTTVISQVITSPSLSTSEVNEIIGTGKLENSGNAAGNILVRSLYRPVKGLSNLFFHPIKFKCNRIMQLSHILHTGFLNPTCMHCTNRPQRQYCSWVLAAEHNNFQHFRLGSWSRRVFGHFHFRGRQSWRFGSNIGCITQEILDSLSPVVECTTFSPYFNILFNSVTRYNSVCVGGMQNLTVSFLQNATQKIMLEIGWNSLTSFQNVSTIQTGKFDQILTTNFSIPNVTTVSDLNLFLFYRLESFHISGVIVVDMTIIIIIILCIFLRNEQPLASKGAIPLISSIARLIPSFTRFLIGQFSSLEVLIKGSFYFDMLTVNVPLISLTYFQYFRYLTMQHIFQRQQALAM